MKNNVLFKALFVGIALTAILVVIYFAQNTNPHTEQRSSVTQYGITWAFDGSYECGQFVNGDWWVVGPVTVTSVTPGPRRATSTEVNDIGVNQWGDTCLKNDSSLRNGSMMVMTPSTAQGYDSRGKSYDPNISINFPYQLKADRSLISSISNDTIPQQVLFSDMMWEAEKSGKNIMKTAAVLTCLSTVPAADAFRPAYIGGDKQIFRLSDVQWDKLMNLAPTALMPNWQKFERYVERPWLDHLMGGWQGQWLLPTRLNQPAYGREYARIFSTASLMLHTKATREKKEKLLIRLIQIGIDFRGIAEVGGFWNEGGGHTSGRKFPILFAGIMLNNPYFANLPSTAIFHEDTETYYGQGWAGQKALWQIVIHHGIRTPYMQKSPDSWETGSWGEISERYRICCNAQAWVGQTLSVLLMKGKSTWNHNAYFDVVEDWMRKEDIYAANRGNNARPPEETTTFPPYDDFISEMWRTYRSNVPEQPDGTTNLFWNSQNSQWEANDPQ